MLLLEKIEQKRKYMFLIIITCIVCCIIYSLFEMHKKITAESTLMLVEVEEKTDNEITNKSNIELTNKMVSNFEEIIKSETSINLINESLKINTNINELKNNIKVIKNSNSDTFKIVVNSDDSNLAIKINNELLKIFADKIKTIYSNAEVYIVDNAHIANNIDYLLILKAILIALLSSILINIIYIIISIEIDKKIKKSKDLESELALKSLCQIPLNKNKNKLIDENSKNSFSVAFRNLRSNIQFINVNNKEKNTILVTSAKKSEGKTVVSTNLAISFAITGKKVILIDADMKSGNVDKIFNIPNDLGLSNYLSGIDENGVEINERINKYIKDTAIKNLNVITSGTIPPNSSELLSMPKFSEMIKDLAVFYDILIIDGTPILNETDGLILARNANSTVIVCNYRKTKKDDLWVTKRDIQNIGGRIIGIIVNKVKLKKEDEKFFNKTKKILKEKYLKIKDYIITKRENRKQKLLDAAIIEEKQKVVEELKNEEYKLLEEIKKDNEKQEQTKKSNIFNNIVLGVKQLKKDESIKIHNKDENKEEDKNQNKEEDKNQNKVEDKNQNKEEDKNQNKVKDKDENKAEDKNENKVEDKNQNKAEDKNENRVEEKIEESILNNENKEISEYIYFKEKIAKSLKVIKEKSLKGILDVKESINKETEKIKEIRKQAEEKRKEKINEVKKQKQEKINEVIPEEAREIIKDSIENQEDLEQKNYNNDQNSILVIVDAENGYCRAFSKYCFAEKLIRGIDKADGFVKANYSYSSISRKRFSLMSKYELTKKQVERIDPLIYMVLQEYDDCIWLERKTTSNKAEDYVLIMSKEYERSVGETKINYDLRCQYLRKIELAKSQIEIEYKLENAWFSKQISFTDKITFFNFAKKFQNFKQRKKIEQKEQRENKLLNKIKLKNPIELLNKVKIEQVKAKSIEELTKEISEAYNQNDIKNYQFEEYTKYNEMTEQELEEQKIKQEEQEMLKEQLKIKQELKEKKLQEKNQKREERVRRRQEIKKNKELKKQKAREEARIEEELSEDNLYPKTKYNKNL